MPWAAALPSGGAAGVVDVVFYGAHGGTGAQPNPQDDPNNVWNAYMAQTIDGGATWTTSKASDHDIHKSQLCIDGLNCNLIGNRDRTLLDFFQVDVDPTNGAADIAYADDQIRPYTFSVAPFLADKNAIQQGYLTSEPFTIEKEGVKPVVKLLADAGYGSYGALLETSQKLAQEKVPAAVKAA